jgi:hypothetical protein
MSHRPATIQTVVPAVLPRPHDWDSAGYLETRGPIFPAMGMSQRVGNDVPVAAADAEPPPPHPKAPMPV